MALIIQRICFSPFRSESPCPVADLYIVHKVLQKTGRAREPQQDPCDLILCLSPATLPSLSELSVTQQTRVRFAVPVIRCLRERTHFAYQMCKSAFFPLRRAAHLMFQFH